MGRTELTAKERARRLNIILEASKTIFLKKGYFKTTMEDIAIESGLSRRTMYLYFKNKDELSYEIVLRAFKSLEKMVKESSLSNRCGLDRLRDVSQGYLNYYKTNFADLTFTMFFDFKINTNILGESQIKECLFLISEIINTIDDCLKIGIEDGSIRNTISDTRKSAIAIINIIHATMQKLAVRRDILETASTYSANDLIYEMFDIFFNSIKS